MASGKATKAAEYPPAQPPLKATRIQNFMQLTTVGEGKIDNSVNIGFYQQLQHQGKTELPTNTGQMSGSKNTRKVNVPSLNLQFDHCSDLPVQVIEQQQQDITSSSSIESSSSRADIDEGQEVHYYQKAAIEVANEIKENNEQSEDQEEEDDDDDEDEESFDFKAEIEKNYSRSVSNKIYSFPRKYSRSAQKSRAREELYESSSSSSNSSAFDSLSDITTYDLHTQNAKYCEKTTQPLEIRKERKYVSSGEANTKMRLSKDDTLESLQKSIQSSIINLIQKSLLKNSQSIRLPLAPNQLSQQQPMVHNPEPVVTREVNQPPAEISDHNETNLMSELNERPFNKYGGDLLPAERYEPAGGHAAAKSVSVEKPPRQGKSGDNLYSKLEGKNSIASTSLATQLIQRPSPMKLVHYHSANFKPYIGLQNLSDSSSLTQPKQQHSLPKNSNNSTSSDLQRKFTSDLSSERRGTFRNAEKIDLAESSTIIKTKDKTKVKLLETLRMNSADSVKCKVTSKPSNYVPAVNTEESISHENRVPSHMRNYQLTSGCLIGSPRCDLSTKGSSTITKQSKQVARSSENYRGLTASKKKERQSQQPVHQQLIGLTSSSFSTSSCVSGAGYPHTLLSNNPNNNSCSSNSNKPMLLPATSSSSTSSFLCSNHPRQSLQFPLSFSKKHIEQSATSNISTSLTSLLPSDSTQLRPGSCLLRAPVASTAATNTTVVRKNCISSHKQNSSQLNSSNNLSTNNILPKRTASPCYPVSSSSIQAKNLNRQSRKQHEQSLNKNTTHFNPLPKKTEYPNKAPINGERSASISKHEHPSSSNINIASKPLKNPKYSAKPQQQLHQSFNTVNQPDHSFYDDSSTVQRGQKPPLSAQTPAASQLLQLLQRKTEQMNHRVDHRVALNTSNNNSQSSHAKLDRSNGSCKKKSDTSFVPLQYQQQLQTQEGMSPPKFIKNNSDLFINDKQPKRAVNQDKPTSVNYHSSALRVTASKRLTTTNDNETSSSSIALQNKSSSSSSKHTAAASQKTKKRKPVANSITFCKGNSSAKEKNSARIKRNNLTTEIYDQ